MKKLITLLMLSALVLVGKAFAFNTYEAVEINNTWVEISPSDGNSHFNIQNICNQALIYASDNTIENPPRLLPLEKLESLSQKVYIKKQSVSNNIRCYISIERYDLGRSAQIEGNIRNATVDETGFDVWEGTATEIPFPALTGETLEIVSTSSEDNPTGLGIQEIDLQLIRPGGIPETITIQLNGTTPVVISGLVTFVNDMYATKNYLKANNVRSTANGTITIYKQGSPTTIYAKIRQGGNKTLSTARYIPSGYKYYIKSILISGDTKGVEGVIRATNTDTDIQTEGFIFRIPFQVTGNGLSMIFPDPILIMPNSYIKATLYSASGSVPQVNLSVLISGTLVKE